MAMAESESMRLFCVVLLLISSIQIECSHDHLLLLFNTQKEQNGQSRSYISRLNVSGTIKDFRLATNAQQVFMGNCTSNTATFTLLKRPVLGPTKNVNFKNIKVVCNKEQNINFLGLGAVNTSFAYQITRAAKLPHIFSYCLGTKHGELRFGEKGPYDVYYNGDILNRTSLPMHYFPLSYDIFVLNNYKLNLDSIIVKSTTVNVDYMILINLDIRYTSLPAPGYDLVRKNFIEEATKKKLKKDSAFGELDLCYKMSKQQMTKFSNVTLIFQGEKWVVTPDNYMAIKRKGVGCFGFINASHLPRGIAVIGTLMQENNFIEYDVKAGKLGVSGSLAANLGLSCSSTYGS